MKCLGHPHPARQGPVLSRVFSSVWQLQDQHAGAPRPDAADLLVPNLRAKCSGPTSREDLCRRHSGYLVSLGRPWVTRTREGGSQSHLPPAAWREASKGAQREGKGGVCCPFGCVSLSELWIAAQQAPLSMGSSRQKYWRRLPCPPPGHLLNPGIEPMSRSEVSCIGRQILYH